MPDPGAPPPGSEIVFYQTEDGRSRIQVRLEDGSVWLSQRLLADLFHATIRKFWTVGTEGDREVSRLVDTSDGGCTNTLKCWRVPATGAASGAAEIELRPYNRSFNLMRVRRDDGDMRAIADFVGEGVGS
jgi:hypothetical protein